MRAEKQENDEREEWFQRKVMTFSRGEVQEEEEEKVQEKEEEEEKEEEDKVERKNKGGKK